MISNTSIYTSLNYYKQEYDTFSDEELIRKIKNGNDQAERCLYKRYIYTIKRISSSFFLMGGSMDDLLQESMIGLIKAVNGYDVNHGASFKCFAEVCIRRQIITAIRKSKANYFLNNVIYFCDIFIENEEISFEDEYADFSNNPEYVVINEEERRQYRTITSRLLTDFERAVLTEYGKGKSYEDISRKLNKNIKAVDNALQRIKGKIKKQEELRILYQS